VAGAISGILAYGIDTHLDGALGRSSWEWLFLIEGIFTAAWGLVVFFVVPKLPETVVKDGSWLFSNEEERAILLRRTIQGSTLGSLHGITRQLTAESARNVPDAKPAAFQVWWGLKDPKTWLDALIIAAPCLDVAAFGNFLPTFVEEFGFSRCRSLYQDSYIVWNLIYSSADTTLHNYPLFYCYRHIATDVPCI
jgi:hypothetical protein